MKEYFYRLIDEKTKREIEEKRKSQTSEEMAKEIGRLFNGARLEMVADEEGIHCHLNGNPTQLLVLIESAVDRIGEATGKSTAEIFEYMAFVNRRMEEK